MEGLWVPAGWVGGDEASGTSTVPEQDSCWSIPGTGTVCTRYAGMRPVAQVLHKNKTPASLSKVHKNKTPSTV